MPCQFDHLLNGYRFEDEHQHTLGICPWHHQGYPVPAHCCGSTAEATEHHGPSRRHNSKAFRERYGSDDELLELQDTMIDHVQAARRRGEFLTPSEFTRLARQIRKRAA